MTIRMAWGDEIMNLEDEKVMFNMGEGCRAHGDEFMRECTNCGMEFCAKCHGRISFCPDCSRETDLDLDPDEDEDPELSAASDLLDDVEEKSVDEGMDDTRA